MYYQVRDSIQQFQNYNTFDHPIHALFVENTSDHPIHVLFVENLDAVFVYSTTGPISYFDSVV